MCTLKKKQMEESKQSNLTVCNFCSDQRPLNPLGTSHQYMVQRGLRGAPALGSEELLS